MTRDTVGLPLVPLPASPSGESLTEIERERGIFICLVCCRYITPPLLLGGRKFDIRVYLLVVAARQFVVLYANGYVRLSCSSYSAASPDLTVHLTNQYQQRKHPEYSAMRDDTVRHINLS